MAKRCRLYHIILVVFNFILACVFFNFFFIIPNSLFVLLGGYIYICDLIHLLFIYIVQEYIHHLQRVSKAMVMGEGIAMAYTNSNVTEAKVPKTIKTMQAE